MTSIYTTNSGMRLTFQSDRSHEYSRNDVEHVLGYLIEYFVSHMTREEHAVPRLRSRVSCVISDSQNLRHLAWFV